MDTLFLPQYLDFTSRPTTNLILLRHMGWNIAGWSEIMKVSLVFCGTEKIAVGRVQWNDLAIRRTGDAETAYDGEVTTA